MVTPLERVQDGHFGFIKAVQHRILLYERDIRPIESSQYLARLKTKGFWDGRDCLIARIGCHRAIPDRMGAPLCVRPIEIWRKPLLHRLSGAERSEWPGIIPGPVYRRPYRFPRQRDNIFDFGPEEWIMWGRNLWRRFWQDSFDVLRVSFLLHTNAFLHWKTY